MSKTAEELVQEISSDIKNFKETTQKSVGDHSADLEEIKSKLAGLDGLATTKSLEDAKADMQKQFNELATKFNNGGMNQAEKKSFRQAVSDSIKEHESVIKGLTSGSVKGTHVVELKDMSMDQNFPGFGNPNYLTTDVRQTSPIDILRDPFQARQIISVGTTSGDTLYYPKVSDTKIGTGPAPWDYSSGAKPEFAPTFEPYTAPVEWIAGIMRVPVQMLQDIAWLTSFLQRYAYLELMDAETNQVFNGNGTSPQLLGIMNVASTYAGTFTLGFEQIIDASLAGLGQYNMSATHVVLNPADVVPIILNKADTSGLYNLPTGVVGVVNGRLTINGITVVTTNKMPKGQWLVGDFNQVQIVQRLAPQLRFFEQDVDNVQKNMVTIRIEERLALPIFRDNAFIKGTFA